MGNVVFSESKILIKGKHEEFRDIISVQQIHGQAVVFMMIIILQELELQRAIPAMIVKTYIY